MKDFPIFTTENGIASLTLKEIPLRQEAYIKIQSSLEPKALLEECVSFCRVCGAERVYGSGDSVVEKYPLHTAILQMRCIKEALGETDACLFPVLPETLADWLSIYNKRMAEVPNAASMSSRDGEDMLKKGDGYFIHRGGELLGIGRASDGKIDTVIATQKGAGKDVLLALATVLTEDAVTVEVASANLPAVKLYEKLGFAAISELSRWYKII